MLIVKDDLPKHLKQSMFEHGGEHAVVCRYSSEPGDPGLDVRAHASTASEGQLLSQPRIAYLNPAASP